MEQNLKFSLIFIHGFLGQGSDWQSIVQSVLPGAASVHFLDLNHELNLAELNFKNWPEAFIRWSKTQNIKAPMCLVGYSMGGRLMAPLLDEGLALRGVFLSSHFGIPEENLTLRAERRQTNKIWAQRFLDEPWAQVSQDWNRQDLFKNSQELIKNEAHFDRQKLAAMLTGFSLSEQKDYSFLWQRKNLKLLYLAGENDLKYRNLAEEMKTKAINSKIKIIKNSGHRLLHDQPQLVAQEILKFIAEPL